MSLFVCEQCRNLDMVELAYPDGVQPNMTLLCTCCLKKPWHGYFPQRKYDAAKDIVVNHSSLKMD